MESVSALRLAATAMLLRSGEVGLEVLMVRRIPELAFGDMWTFPGGAIDADDGPAPAEIDEDDHDWGAPTLVATAANAAVRETREETGLVCSADRLVWFSHWIPPRRHRLKRFATWFFLAPDPTVELELDLTENSDARWVSPRHALAENNDGRFPLAVPTWITLDDLRRFEHADDVTTSARTRVRMQHTRHIPTDDAIVLCWAGDAAYDSGDLAAPGSRNRVVMSSDGGVQSRVVAD